MKQRGRTTSIISLILALHMALSMAAPAFAIIFAFVTVEEAETNAPTSGELNDGGPAYSVTVNYGAEAGLPENISLTTREIAADDPDYEGFFELALEAAEAREREVLFARFFEIAIEGEDGKVQPAEGSTVGVKIAVGDLADLPEDTQVSVLHFPDADGAAAELATDPAAPSFLPEGETFLSAPLRLESAPLEALGTPNLAFESVGEEEDLPLPEEDTRTEEPRISYPETIETTVNPEEGAVVFETGGFSVYGIVGTVEITNPGDYVFEGDGYTIIINVPEEAEIPAGTILEVSERDPASEEYFAHWNEAMRMINPEFFDYQEHPENYTEEETTPFDNVYTHPKVILDARFFSVTFKDGEEEIEPKTPVTVNILYDSGIDVSGAIESGVIHFGRDATELIDDADITVVNGTANKYTYVQDSFSDIGTFSYVQTRDILDGSRPYYITGGKARSAKSNNSIGAPAASKALSENGDGTYTLSLSVTGAADIETDTEIKKANVIFVMDTSQSMDYLLDPQIWHESDGIDPERTYYGVSKNQAPGEYVALTRMNDAWYMYSNYTHEYNRYSGTVYYGDKSRFSEERKALKEMVGTLLANNDPSKPGQSDVVEIGIVRFSQEYITYTDTLITDKDQLYGYIDLPACTEGNRTNWAGGLYNAEQLLDSILLNSSQAGEDNYVIFLTDGKPNHGLNGSYGNDHEGAEAEAAVIAERIVQKGGKLYSIFTFKTASQTTDLLQDLTNDAYNSGTAVDDYFFDASNTEELVSAFENLISEITNTISVGNVTVSDGLTTDATAITLVNGSADGFVYTVTGPLGELYSVTAAGSDTNPTVTFTVNGQTVAGEKKTVQVTRNQIDEDGNPIPDPDNPGKYLTVTEEKMYYSATVGGTEYKMALASIAANGQITWDLSAVGALLSGYTYKCSFVVWPDQEAYDYVAGLNNGLSGYEWDEDADVEVLDENGDVIYYTNGVSRFPSIVRYPNGTYSVLTNTNQSVTYSIVNTTKDETTGETETTYDGPYTKPLEYPDPMDLTGSSLSITKYWDDSMDAQ